MIEAAFAELPEVEVMLFEPVGAPAPEAMPVRTKRPRMTVARALFSSLIQQYAKMSYRLTLLEIQKLAYFLQEAGQPLRLNYQAGLYGPYAPNLNKVLEALEGHFTRGYGDNQQPDVEIALLDGAVKEAEAFLANCVSEHERLERVSQVIDGFETPYGLELTSSVHWLAVHGEQRATDVDAVEKGMHTWSTRKGAMFRPAHIRVEWDQLADGNWLPNEALAKPLQAHVAQASCP